MSLFFGYSSLFIFILDSLIKLNTAIYKLGVISIKKEEIFQNYVKKDFLLDYLPNFGTLLSLIFENNLYNTVFILRGLQLRQRL